MTKDELRAALVAIDGELKLAEDAAAPAREALQPFQAAIDAIEERRELLLEENEVAYSGKCLGCSLILFEGDPACVYGEDGYLCENCSPTLGEALADTEKNRDDLDVEEGEIEEQIAHLKSRIAAEGADVKLVFPL